MNWIEIALIGAVLVGATAGTALVVRSLGPDFILGLAVAMVKAALPFITKRMTPEEEAEWRHEVLAGRGDEWLKKRRKKRPQ